MLLLSFPSQTSHFWQLGGVTQSKMRSLLRLLVKSIIEDGTRQANAAAARKAHHSASPTVDPSEQDAQDMKRRRTRGLTHFRQTDFGIFIATLGLLFFYFLLSNGRENPWQRVSLMSRQSITTVICFSFARDVVRQTISDGFARAFPEDTVSGFIYSTFAGSICSRVSVSSLLYHK